jgi:hypothetical protein
MSRIHFIGSRWPEQVSAFGGSAEWLLGFSLPISL